MLWVVLGAVVSLVVGAGVYLWRERLGPAGAGMAALRAVALTVLVLVWVNPARTERVRGGPPTVLLDASLSMTAAGGHWREAVDTALALAGSPERVLRFGSAVARFDTVRASDGTTRLADALRVASARSGPVIVVSDGVVDDAAVVPPGLLRGVQVVLLPRDPVADAALVDVSLEPRAQRGDSVSGTFLVATTGPLPGPAGQLEVRAGARRLLLVEVTLPPPPGIARRAFALPAGLLSPGTHVLTFQLRVPGDREPGDDTRLRIISVTEQPHVVALVNPPDWEGRFLVATLGDVASTTVRGFARVRPDRWVDMRTLTPVTESEVRAGVRGAALVLARGDLDPELQGWDGPVWRWPAGTDAALQTMPGDWYITPETPASPVGGRLAAAEWDSVPPLDDLVPTVVRPGAWVGLTARLGRRGSERPVLVGRDTAGIRTLTTTANGLWRWALRGGAAREAYRAFVAGGVDWLMGTDAVRRAATLTASAAVARGLPIAFRWHRSPVPDSLPLHLEGSDSSVSAVLRFDAFGIARIALPPGTYRWTAPGVTGGGATGIAAVESYSEEFRVRPASFQATEGEASFSVLELHPRDLWWLFALVVAAFVGEWAWRLSRGLP